MTFMNTTESPEQKAEAASPYTEMWLRGWEPYVRMFGQFAQPSAAVADLGKLQQRYMEFASKEGAAAYRRFSELSANYYAALLNTGLNLSQEFYEQVYQTRTTPSVPFQAPVAPARELVFTGPIGSTVSRSFVISNKTDKPVHVSFELSEFINESGSAKVRVDAQLRPGSFELAGMAEQTVDCSLPLTRAFQPGSEYRAVLRVVGFENMTVGLVVRAESAAAREKLSVSGTTGRRRKKKRKA
jgi:hypothetical protein